jgi:rod shape-determining protein MreC
MLAGNNTSEPSLDALPPNAKLKTAGDVVTSGDGGLLPAGLPVGVLAIRGREIKVRPYADPLATDEVRILDFKSPVEPMPKPTDSLPVPAKLEPPPPSASAEIAVKPVVVPNSAQVTAQTHSGAQETRTANTPAPAQTERPPAMVRVITPKTSPENRQIFHPQQPADQPQDDQTNDQ